MSAWSRVLELSLKNIRSELYGKGETAGVSTIATVPYLQFDVLLQRVRESSQRSIDAGSRGVEDDRAAGLRQAVGAE